MIPRRILIIQLRRVGDVLLTTPAISNLRKQFPQAKIDFLVESPGKCVLDGNPNLDEILCYDKSRPLWWLRHIRSRRYDWVIDFLGNPRTMWITLASGAPLKAGFDFIGRGWVYRVKISRPKGPRHIVQQKLDLLRALGVRCEDVGLEMHLAEKDRAQAEKFLQGQGVGPRDTIIGIIPTHRRQTRRWTAHGFAAVADHLQKAHRFKTMLFWGPGEETQTQAVMEAMETKPIIIPLVSLTEMAALLQRCRAVVTNCNGPMHLAEAIGTPTLTIYGPTQPEVWNPGGPDHRIIQAVDVACLGCNLNECPTQHECMRDLPARRVWRELERMLGLTAPASTEATQGA